MTHTRDLPRRNEAVQAEPACPTSRGDGAWLRRCIALAMLLGSTLPAQTRPDAKQELATKLAAPFLRRAAWVLDYDDALWKASKEGRLIFGYFTTAGP